MHRIAAIYQDFGLLQDALKQMTAEGYTKDDVEVTHASNPHTSIFSPGYDPIGGARFAGSPIGTMAATGGNLVGNSVTIDVSLNLLSDLLASIADIEQSNNDNPTPTRYLLTVKGKYDGFARLVQDTGGEIVDLD